MKPHFFPDTRLDVLCCDTDGVCYFLCYCLSLHTVPKLPAQRRYHDSCITCLGYFIYSFFQIQDLMYFVVILMVFVISYAIASHSILFPNSPLNGDTIIAVLRRSYWNIYGELFLDELAGKFLNF